MQLHVSCWECYYTIITLQSTRLDYIKYVHSYLILFLTQLKLQKRTKYTRILIQFHTLHSIQITYTTWCSKKQIDATNFSYRNWQFKDRNILPKKQAYEMQTKKKRKYYNTEKWIIQLRMQKILQ